MSVDGATFARVSNARCSIEELANAQQPSRQPRTGNLSLELIKGVAEGNTLK